MAKVYNLKNKDAPNGSVYVGRPTPWGNPFRIGKDGDRATVIRKYEKWLRANHKLMLALPELKGQNLICHCAPEPCHADVLLKLANEDLP